MPAVQLTDGQQVEATNKDRKPGGKGPGIDIDVIVLWDVAQEVDQVLHPAQQERRTQRQAVRLRGQGRRDHQADEKEGQGDRNAGERAGSADVKQGVAVFPRGAHADDGTHGADQTKGERDKVGQAAVEAVLARGKIVPKLVHCQDAHDRQRRGNPAEEQARVLKEAHQAFVKG